MKTELKAVEILMWVKTLKRTNFFGDETPVKQEIQDKIDEALAELQYLTQKSCKECALINREDGSICDTAQKTKEATGMKYTEMCFHCYTPKG